MKAKRLVIDVKKKEKHEEEFEFTPSAVLEKADEGVDFEKLKKLIKYAEAKGWLRV